jgi:hypothetical protein
VDTVVTSAGPKESKGFPTKAVVGVGAAIFLLIVVASAGSGPATAPDGAANASNVTVDAAATSEPATAKPDASVENWTYSTDLDKVRGGTTYYASTTSTNSIRQSFPYDADTTMRMAVRKSPAYGTDVILTISSGQMMCPSYEGCSGTVSFDGGPAQRVSFAGPADNSSDTVFVDGAQSFIAKLRHAKKVVIEKTLYEAGNPQFEFDVAGLRWDH